jgi:PAS domain S-box-containing protein
MRVGTQKSTVLLLTLGMVAIFISDLLTMAGFAHGVLYVLVVLVAMMTGDRRVIFTIAAVSSVLIIIGLQLSPPAPDNFPMQYVLANRLISVLVVMAAALLAVARIHHLRGRRQAEQALQSTGQMLRLASDVARVGGWSVQLEPPAVHWTAEVHRIHGTEPGQEPDLDDAISYYSADDQDRIRDIFNACITEGLPFDEELQVINTAGNAVWVRVAGRPTRNDQGKIVGAHGAFMDIDQSKRLASRLASTLERISDAFFLLDRDWRFSFLNRQAEVVLERRRQDLLGKNVWDEFPAAVDSDFQRHYEHAMASQESVSFEAYYPPLERWFNVHAYPSNEGLAVYFQDITQRREADQQLHLLEAAINRINDMVLITEARPIDEPGPRIIYVNQAFERETGYSKKEAIGHSPRFLQGPQTSRQELDRIRRALEQGRAVRSQLVNYTRAGASYQTEIDLTPLTDIDGQVAYFVAVQRDVSERVAMEEQLRQSQRLEAIGQLTGGIAHDFNNLLTVILGNAELLQEELSSDVTFSDIAGMVVSAAQRGAALTQHLLAFARRQALEPSPTNINQTVSHMDKLLRRSLGDHVEIELVLGAGLWPAMVDETQLESALLNLSLNSRDAMTRGGRLTIETANAHLDHAYAEQHAEVNPGQYVMIAVSDTGRGIAPADLARVFEPFYTTKDKGKGTGLGLSMIYGFIKQSEGHVKIYSEPGHGTTVRMYLPRAASPARPTDYPQKELPSETGNETILLVEDDELVRDYVQRQLIDLGYRVIVAANGEQALSQLDQEPDIDLLFTDVVMPGGISGRQLADLASQQRPGLKILYTSGYTENAIVHHGRLDPDVQLLSKPYRRAELARRLRKILDEPTTSGSNGDPLE